MQIHFRQYNHASDYEKVGQFLINTYRTSGGHINWLQPRWEYMHYHPLIWNIDLGVIGVWEMSGKIVGVVHPENSMGIAYFEIDDEYAHLKRDMLLYAQERLSIQENGVNRLRLLILDEDEDFQHLASELGYKKGEQIDPICHLPIQNALPAASLPQGFRLQSLADDNDLCKLHRVLWRGFDHGDEPPDDGFEERTFMQSAPNYRKDLNIVVVAPDSNFVSYCGMWYEPINRIAYVEPVTTDPDYRRMGLGCTVVMEGIRRCGELGATVACVGATMIFIFQWDFTKHMTVLSGSENGHRNRKNYER